MGAVKQVARVLRRVPWLASALLIAAGLVINLATPRDAVVGAAFSAAPMAAAALWTFRGTAVVAGGAIVSFALVLLYWDRLGTADSIARLATTATVGLLSLVVSQALRVGEARLASASEVAEALQVALMPVPPERIGRYSFATRYEAAHAEAKVGGDLYGVRRTPFGVRLMVGDVRGKGLEAIAGVSTVLGAFHEAADTEPDLAVAAAKVEQSLLRDNERVTDGSLDERFVTAVLVEIPDGEPSVLRVVNRGHPAPLLFPGAGRPVQVLEPDSCALPLGLGDLGGGPAGEAREWAFPPGALLLLYTDGVSEARDAHGVFYDPRARLTRRSFPNPAGLLDTVVKDVRRHTGGETDDDMALLAVMHTPAEGRRR
ncbi:hypothetical protein SRB5_39640 [Streptomyces sp. RB5]|uniref:PPM-type phosphatase domain-containing protein n=1 Tax=Streptomyces smaragdinus TaxID=2585196 RepID=A0A7K0CJY8_9ACTN|nr:PP2C family protein-serine/threonine phosphatase [Streptomyces smaragdinus]MQY13809.1 hypothetical protein [Streptomyces smaragdinus]